MSYIYFLIKNKTKRWNFLIEEVQSYFVIQKNGFTNNGYMVDWVDTKKNQNRAMVHSLSRTSKVRFFTISIIIIIFSCSVDRQVKKIDGYTIVTIDSCEYIEMIKSDNFGNENHSLTHKGNCKNHLK
jgi:hypothetical protein